MTDPTMRAGNQKGYSVMIDSDTGTVANDEIFCIDAHANDPDDDQYPPQYEAPDLSPENLGLLVDALHDVERSRMAGLVETKQRQLEDNPNSPLYFTAVGLSDTATMLTLGLAQSQQENDLATQIAINEFGGAIHQSCDGPYLAERYEKIDFPKIKPEGDEVFIDPFEVIVGKQDVVFTDTHGNEI